MSIVYFLKNFNNYYNRIVKKYDNIQDYVNNAGEYSVRGTSLAIQFENKGPVNFNIGDGISGLITYNYDSSQTWQPDYVVICDDDESITSRWFCLEAHRTRKGQYQLILRRDLVADNYNAILESPMFVEKAILSKSDPFIFNKENMQYNQIKSNDEIVLKDNSGTAWVVGYVAPPQNSESSTPITKKIKRDVDYTVNGIENFESNKVGWNILYNMKDIIAKFYVKRLIYSGRRIYQVRADASSCEYNNITTPGSQRYIEKYINASKNAKNVLYYTKNSNLQNNIINSICQIYEDAFQQTINNAVIKGNEIDYVSLNDKIVLDNNTGLYYRFYVNRFNLKAKEIAITSSYPSLYETYNDIAKNSFNVLSSSETSGFGLIMENLEALYVGYELLGDSPEIDITTSISGTRRELSDAPYSMFAIPLSGTLIKPDNTEITIENVAAGVGSAIAEKLTSSKCYDLQLLPYCPRQDLIKNGKISLQASSVVEGKDFNYITDTNIQGNHVSVILWGTSSSFTIDIGCSIPMPDSSIETKVDSETTFYRLCSPNYSGAYEFVSSQNYGVNYINIDCAYKPYTPYIHANIDFNGIYGRDTNDTRGLICGGDFSLPQTSDQWASYELNNKNYENSFNRGITNQKRNRNLERVGDVLGVLSGAVGGLVQGAKAGGEIGAVVGGVLGTVGGVADYAINEVKFEENINYQTDLYIMKNQNVQAQPDTLGKVSAYNPNNKVFLFIEKYTCTEEEKEALRNKIKYNGMTVDRIGTINEFLSNGEYEDYNYIKGKIIRVTNSSDDYHAVNELGIELSKGVFIRNGIGED